MATSPSALNPAWAEMAANLTALSGGSPSAGGGANREGEDDWDLRQIQWPQHLADPSDSSSSSSGFLAALGMMPPSGLYSGAGETAGKGKGNGFWNSIQDRWPAEVPKTSDSTTATAAPERQGADGSQQISWPREHCTLDDDEHSAGPPPPPPAICSTAASTAPPSRDSREDASLLSLSTDLGPAPTEKPGSKKCIVSL